MRLTKLELNGFKSFARKTEIVFSNGITAVIGPNGSGKSNIADAIKWVLGEQSAKALRGGKMEDVIFNGTQSRKAQSFCEVTLTFDNSDGKLATPFTELAVTRRVYRDGDGEYCINGNACRLRDIADLFRDTGIGKDGYSIIGQGRVDEILSNRSNERRSALEEAAGVMRYRVRKEEAERKLANTEKNLERIEDIVQELSARLGPLEAQSASARTYLKLRDELKDYEVNLFLYQYERNHERLLGVQEAIEQMQRDRAVLDTSEQTMLLSCAELEEKCRLLENALTAQQNKLMQMLSGVEAHVGEANVLNERKEHAKQTCLRIAAELSEAQAKREALASALSGMESDDAQAAALTALDCDIADTQAELTKADEQLADAETALEEMKNSIIEAMNRMSDAKSDISRFDAMKAAVEARLAALSGEGARQSGEEEKLRGEYETAQALLAVKTAALQDAKDALAGAQANRIEIQNAFAKLTEDVQRDEQQLSAAESRLRVLSEMAKSREGYFASVKNIMRDAEKDKRLSQAIVGVVAELIRVPVRFETAIGMALGASMQNIVTPTAEDAKYVIEYLRAHDYGRATLLPKALLHPEYIRDREREFLSMPGVIGIASELLECDENVRDVMDYLLGRTVVVEDLDSGIQLKKQSRGAFHIATLQGDMISTGGSMSGGSVQKRAFSLLGREREIAELTESLSGVERALAEKKEQLRGKERALVQSDIQVDAFRDALHGAELDLAKQTEQLEIIRRDVEKASQAQGQLDEERMQLAENLADIEMQREAATRQQTDIEEGSEATREDVKNAQESLGALRLLREEISVRLTERKVRRMALAKERDAVTAEHRRVQGEYKASETRITALSEEYAKNDALIQSVTTQLEQMLSGINGEQSAAEAEKQAQRKLEEERTAASNALREQRARREELMTEARALAERLHKQEMTQSRLTMELAAMSDHIWEEYELTYENALQLRHDIAIGATNSRIAEIKTEIRELGDINLGSIEDYKAVFERHAQLSVQCEDLVKAKADLETLIIELTGTMQDVFVRQFELIRTNFARVFTELFGGGQAEMRLADRMDVLNCDIEIIAQPPGKKLQLLSLLSGGERALTAIALLFAMLQLKPPAFCLLDEIESSLDEVNVTRFANYLQHYSDDTQFILITHRKGSMEVCNCLYGVSMEEKGISKIVSARFGEAG